MTQATTAAMLWTGADLALLPDNGRRYEIIDGELFMSAQPHWEHQTVCVNVCVALAEWSQATGLGRATIAPGVLFGDYDNVIPDVAWVAQDRLDLLLDAAGHLTGAPDLAVEVLSAGAENERRDREVKRKLYGVRGVREYWIVDRWRREVEVYRRQNARLELEMTLTADDSLTSPILPDFTCPVARLFA